MVRESVCVPRDLVDDPNNLAGLAPKTMKPIFFQPDSAKQATSPKFQAKTDQHGEKEGRKENKFNLHSKNALATA